MLINTTRLTAQVFFDDFWYSFSCFYIYRSFFNIFLVYDVFFYIVLHILLGKPQKVIFLVARPLRKNNFFWSSKNNPPKNVVTKLVGFPYVDSMLRIKKWARVNAEPYKVNVLVHLNSCNVAIARKPSNYVTMMNNKLWTLKCRGIYCAFLNLSFYKRPPSPPPHHHSIVHNIYPWYNAN